MYFLYVFLFQELLTFRWQRRRRWRWHQQHNNHNVSVIRSNSEHIPQTAVKEAGCWFWRQWRHETTQVTGICAEYLFHRICAVSMLALAAASQKSEVGQKILSKMFSSLKKCYKFYVDANAIQNNVTKVLIFCVFSERSFAPPYCRSHRWDKN